MERNRDSSQAGPRRSSRREFLKLGGKVAATSALAGVAIPAVHSQDDGTIRLAIVGSGNRGSGAVRNALSVPGGNTKLYAMADLFEDKLNKSYKALSERHPDKVEVPPERQFLGFDAYRKAIDCLRPGSGDVALLTTHAGFRRVHFDYAVEKGVHVFMEKSFAPDPGGLQRMIRAGERANEKNLKVGCGLMCRHSVARQALIRKMRDGDIGDVLLVRAYRMGGGGRLGPRKSEENEIMWQIRRPGHFLWASSGRHIELMIHQVDECCWIMDSFPIAAHGLGGRVPDSTDCSQNHDAYSIELTFANGAKALIDGRSVPGCHSDFSTYVHGTKCGAQFSGNVHAATVHTYANQQMTNDNITWRAEKEPYGPHQAEWNVLIDAIQNDKPHNEMRRAAYGNLAAIMGRAAVHSGKIITWDEAIASDFKFCPNVDDLNENSPAPVQADEQGRYPAPIPGKWEEI
ncbi:MAG: hypothetical protein PVJ27_01630 [Candidatus Brocadiaceae bacterium]|jgi:predicted dehydrogenase